jgi:erythromycin esterase
MKLFILVITCFLSIQSHSQNDDVVSWINENAITIEDANPDTKLSIFNNNIPQKFAEAKLFGFGEATHHGKEFFDIKAKFFKYLVENQDVKVFIMEESYPSEAGINEWISGGKGNVETIAQNFNIVPWYCKEVVNLLEWMRKYNVGKTEEQQIRFYGMDIQNVKNINQEIRNLVTKYTITVSEDLLATVDKCVERKVDYKMSNKWADEQIPKLNEMEHIITSFQKDLKKENDSEFNSALRALNYLIKYTYYVQHSHSHERDLKMYENVKWLVENKSKNGKAFIWAHNEHTNNQGVANYSTRKIYNLGRHLKEQYKNDYYSVGFDFGKGTLGGYVFKENENALWKTYQVNEPFKGTYAETLINADKEIFFVEMSKSISEKTNFFKKKNKQLLLGGPGYNPNHTNLYTKKFSEMFDGLIFIKSISVPTYKLRIE